MNGEEVEILTDGMIDRLMKEWTCMCTEGTYFADLADKHVD